MDNTTPQERTISTQEEAEAIIAEIKAAAAPIRKAYLQNRQKIKDTKRQVRKRQNNARRNAQRNKKGGN